MCKWWMAFCLGTAFTSSGGEHPLLEVKATPRQKAIHHLHVGRHRSKQKEL
jgi:hypothetical protein